MFTLYAYENVEFMHSIVTMARKKRVILELGPEHERELKWLMARWHQNKSEAMRWALSFAVKCLRQDDLRAAGTKKPDEET